MTSKLKLKIESIKVFFPASLELQEELLEAGFKVPYDRESGKRMPIPVVASYSQGRTIKNMLLNERGDKGRVEVGDEETILKVSIEENGFVKFSITPISYHLEDLGFPAIPPRIWGTWVSMTIDSESMNRIYNALPENDRSEKGFSIGCNSGTGDTIELYSYKGRKWKNLGIPVFSYGFGMKKLSLVMRYLEEKARENNMDVRDLYKLKLGLRKEKDTKAGIKIGMKWKKGGIEGFTIKLSSIAPKIKIAGLYGELTGKSRGKLDSVDEWSFVVHGDDLRNAVDTLMKWDIERH